MLNLIKKVQRFVFFPFLDFFEYFESFVDFRKLLALKKRKRAAILSYIFLKYVFQVMFYLYRVG